MKTQGRKNFALNIHVEPKMVYGTERRIYNILKIFPSTFETAVLLP